MRLVLTAAFAMSGVSWLLVLAAMLIRRRRRAKHDSEVTPQWLNENVYEKRGDDRW